MVHNKVLLESRLEGLRSEKELYVLKKEDSTHEEGEANMETPTKGGASNNDEQIKEEANENTSIKETLLST